MSTNKKALACVLVVASMGWLAGCNSDIDDEPNVVLEIENATIPPVTASLDQLTQTCQFTITNANATFKNKPKNGLAGTSPFNDILLDNVVIAYTWDDGQANPVNPRTFGVAGSVPANGSSTAQFGVVAIDDLFGALVPISRDGHTASLVMQFNGRTVSGDAVSVSTGGTLSVNSCF